MENGRDPEAGNPEGRNPNRLGSMTHGDKKKLRDAKRQNKRDDASRGFSEGQSGRKDLRR